MKTTGRKKLTVPLDRKWLYALTGGDKVLRIIGGCTPMLMTVNFVNERVVSCGPWRFSRMWGLEVDDVMGSDGTPKTTVLSYIRKPTEEEISGGRVLTIESAPKDPYSKAIPF